MRYIYSVVVFSQVRRWLKRKTLKVDKPKLANCVVRTLYVNDYLYMYLWP
eukprot:m.54301 g.54301  ORF g.54301 m.54301 type:complete len:50 (+) comp11407_c0_seq2:5592-5741(+)